MPELYWTWRGHRIAYCRIDGPSQRRAILCIHGFGACKEHWRHTLQPLAASATVYAVDLLGFGHSSKPPSQLRGEAPLAGAVHYGFKLWGEQISQFCREVIGCEAGQPVAQPGDSPTAREGSVQLQLIGNSIGGVVALNASRLLLEQGLAPQQLILIDCAERELDVKRLAEQPWPLQLSRPLLMAVVRQRWLVFSLFRWFARPALIRQVLRQAYPSGRNVDDQLVELLLKPTRDPGALEIFRGFVNLFDDWLAPELLALLSAQRHPIPVQLLWGGADPWEPLPEAESWQRRFPCVQELRVLPGLGHCPHDEDPDQANPVLLRWLEQGWNPGTGQPATFQRLDTH